jgi:hypothetical protein
MKTIKPAAQNAQTPRSANVLPFDIVHENGVDTAIYRDDTDTALACSFALSHGGNLSEIDQFIFDLPDDAPIKADLKLWRAQAVQYFLRRDNHHDMVMFALQKVLTIYERVRAIRLEISFKPAAERGHTLSRIQRERAKLPRPKWVTEDTSLFDVVCLISGSPSGREETAKALWQQLYGELDSLHANPQEKAEGDDPKKWYISYKLWNGNPTKLAFSTFEKLIKKARESH